MNGRTKVISFINDEQQWRKNAINPPREHNLQFVICPVFPKSPVEHHTVRELGGHWYLKSWVSIEKRLLASLSLTPASPWPNSSDTHSWEMGLKWSFHHVSPYCIMTTRSQCGLQMLAGRAIPNPTTLQLHLLRGTSWSVSLFSFSIKLSNTLYVVDNPLKCCMFISMLI